MADGDNRLVEGYLAEIAVQTKRSPESIEMTGLLSEDFPQQSVLIEFEDGSTAQFNYAFVVQKNMTETPRLGVFTRHCGAHEFLLSALRVVRVFEKEPLDRELSVLRKVVNVILEEARASPTKICGPINWADLRCVQAERYETDEGDIGYRAIISEAAPDAYALHMHLSTRMAEQGIFDVEIVTEW
jgi:hypothetical protein